MTLCPCQGTNTDMEVQADFMCMPKPMRTLHETQRVHYRKFFHCAVKKAFLIKVQAGVFLLAYSNMEYYSGAPQAWDISSGCIKQ